MDKKDLDKDPLLRRLSVKYNLSCDLLQDCLDLFNSNNIPIFKKAIASKKAARVLMISTHGYWSDPPPTGLPDTGGQTRYVLEVSKAWARQGRKVIIIARWFAPHPRVEKYADNVWLIRVAAGGDAFVRKEDIYPLVPEMAEASTAIAALFGAQGVVGHYADGMAGAIEVGVRLKIPAIVIAHSLGLRKMQTMGFDPKRPESWFDPQYNFWIRESFELNALRAANLEIANTPREPEALKDFYNEEFPNIVMQAGASDEFFKAYMVPPRALTIEQYGLAPKKYLIFYGRFSEAKNIPGVVALFGEAKKLSPGLFGDIKLALAGGSRREPLDEEKVVEYQIRDVMQKYDLNDSDVVRIYGHLDAPIITALVHHSLCYVGMQIMEPFGMGVAESMAAGAPVIISMAAGITKWMKDGLDGIVVDPEDPKAAAGKLLDALKDKRYFNSISKNGYRLARAEFSWLGIAKQIGASLDRLLGKSPKAHHRFTFAWHGEIPDISNLDKKTAKEMCVKVVSKAGAGRKMNLRTIIDLRSMTSSAGVGVAEYLRILLRKDKIFALTVPANLFDEKSLKEALSKAADMGCQEIYLPSVCRSLPGRKYTKVPVSLKTIDVIIVSD